MFSTVFGRLFSANDSSTICLNKPPAVPTQYHDMEKHCSVNENHILKLNRKPIIIILVRFSKDVDPYVIKMGFIWR